MRVYVYPQLPIRYNDRNVVILKYSGVKAYEYFFNIDKDDMDTIENIAESLVEIIVDAKMRAKNRKIPTKVEIFTYLVHTIRDGNLVVRQQTLDYYIFIPRGKLISVDSYISNVKNADPEFLSIMNTIRYIIDEEIKRPMYKIPGRVK